VKVISTFKSRETFLFTVFVGNPEKNEKYGKTADKALYNMNKLHKFVLGQENFNNGSGEMIK
jgi:hypothetical protein